MPTELLAASRSRTPIVNASGHLRRARRRARLRRRALRPLPVRRLRHQDGHARAAGRQPAAAAVGARGGDDQLDRAAQQGARSASSPRTCPALADLPVPLIVNVMGSHRRRVRAARRGVRPRATRSPALELNVSCPNVKTGLDIGAVPAEAAALVERLRPLTRQAADRQAHAQHRLAGRGRRGGRGRRRRRRLADQHPARHGAAPAHARAVARRAHRRACPGPAVRAVALAQVAAVRAPCATSPIVGMGGVQSGRHARDLLDAGATVVAVGTEIVPRPARGRQDRRRAGAADVASLPDGHARAAVSAISRKLRVFPADRSGL